LFSTAVFSKQTNKQKITSKNENLPKTHHIHQKTQILSCSYSTDLTALTSLKNRLKGRKYCVERWEVNQIRMQAEFFGGC